MPRAAWLLWASLVEMHPQEGLMLIQHQFVALLLSVTLLVAARLLSIVLQCRWILSNEV